MLTAAERAQFLADGYLVVEHILPVDHLSRLQEAFDEVWAAEGAPPCTQYELLKYRAFLELIEYPPILDRQRAIFRNQVQLLQYDLLRQGPADEGSPAPDAGDRWWHRDFVFPGDRPLAINTLLFLDDITPEKGPTRVVPRSHMGEGLPTSRGPIEGEVAVPVPAGSAIFINAALWHSRGRNASAGLRRGVYLYYGYWWLKRYTTQRARPGGGPLPWQAYEGASEQRLRLLGARMPDRDLHQYDPQR